MKSVHTVEGFKQWCTKKRGKTLALLPLRDWTYQFKGKGVILGLWAGCYDGVDNWARWYKYFRLLP